jgi:hypothetical protein
VRAVVERHRARLLVAAAVGGYFGLLAALGGYARWSRLGVSSSNQWFGDLRSVTSAWECTRRGLAVLPVNPCDPYQRPANYPRLWLLPSHLGLGLGDTVPIGLAIGGVFLLAALAVVPQRASLRLGAVYALALCSPAAMLGVNRGNVDLTLFALVFAAVVLAQHQGRRFVAAGACVLLAAVLKLFPLFSVAFFFRRASRAAVEVGYGVIVAFAIYAIALHDQLHDVITAVPQGDDFSYGVRRVSEWTGTAAREAISGKLTSFRAWDVVLVVGAAVAAVLLEPRLRRLRTSPSERELDLFWAGAAVYVCTYAIARSFDYRLVFLLAAVPQLARWARQSVAAGVGLVALLAAMWFDEWIRPPLVGGALRWWADLTAVGPNGQSLSVPVLAQYVLFVVLLAGLLATRPPWRTWLGRR